MLCKWNKSLVYRQMPVFVMSQRSNITQMIVKLLFDMLKSSQKHLLLLFAILTVID